LGEKLVKMVSNFTAISLGNVIHIDLRYSIGFTFPAQYFI
jgi:hypothetical protein